MEHYGPDDDPDTEHCHADTLAEAIELLKSLQQFNDGNPEIRGYSIALIRHEMNDRGNDFFEAYIHSGGLPEYFQNIAGAEHDAKVPKRFHKEVMKHRETLIELLSDPPPTMGE